MRYGMTFVAFTTLLTYRSAAADEELADKLIGSWRVLSQKIQVIGEAAERDLLGENPLGRIIFSPDGHFATFISRGDRKPPQSDADAAEAMRTMVAYTGKFRIEGDRAIYTVDGAWSEVYKQQEQIRMLRLDGDTLTSITPESASGLFPGKRVHGVAIFIKERGP